MNTAQEHYRHVQNLFDAALAHPRETRAKFLAEVCAGDFHLLHEVVELLAQDTSQDAYFDAVEAKIQSDVIAALFRTDDTPVTSHGFHLGRLIGQVLDGRYQIDKQLGAGGMGAVFLATHLHTKRPVAVKVIAPEFANHPEFVERFRREAVAAGRLRHPNVVNATDFGFTRVLDNSLAYLVMEYLDGQTLQSLLTTHRQLPARLVVDILEQVCLAVDKAHQQGIVHRDLKPDNIWLEPTGRGGYHVKVLDFGIAKLRDITSEGTHAQALLPKLDPAREQAQTLIFPDSNLTWPLPPPVNDSEPATQVQESIDTGRNREQTAGAALTRLGTVLGTPTYMSPEQCQGQPVDHRSDIYSLGVIAYQMLAGEPPFSGDMFQLLVKHTELPPPSLRPKRLDVPDGVLEVVERALAKHPEERPATAMAFAQALRVNLGGVKELYLEALDFNARNSELFQNLSAIITLPYLVLLLVPVPIFAFAPLYKLAPWVISLLQIGKWIYWVGLSLVMTQVWVAGATLLVQQLRTTPAAQIRIRPIVARLIRQLPALAVTSLPTLAVVFSPIKNWSGSRIQLWMDGAVSPQVVIVEGGTGKAAVVRSQQILSLSGSLRNVFQWWNLVWIIGNLMLFFLLAVVLFGFFHVPEFPVVSAGVAVMLFLCLGMAVSARATILVIVQALFFLKTRQMIDASTTELLQEVVEFEVPKLARFSRLTQVFPACVPAGTFLLTLWMVVWGFPIFSSLVYLTNWKHNAGAVRSMVAICGIGSQSILFRSVGAICGIEDQSFLDNVELRMAASEGNVLVIQLFLDQGLNPNTRGEGWALLALAAENGQRKVVDLLLERGADVNAAGSMTPLMGAVESRQIELVKLFLDRGAKVNGRGDYSSTPLFIACYHLSDPHPNDEKIIRLLLEKGAHPDVQGGVQGEETPLKLAAKHRRTEIVELLKAYGARE